MIAIAGCSSEQEKVCERLRDRFAGCHDEMPAASLDHFERTCAAALSH